MNTTAIKNFGKLVTRAAKACETGKLGSKVLISHVWANSGYSMMTLCEFKAHLIEAHRAGALRLCRLDMVQLFPIADQRESEIEYMGITSFHMVDAS